MADLEEIENEMKKHRSPVVTVRDVMDAVDGEPSDTHIRQQLRALEATGRVRSKDVGARAVAWWHEERVCDPFVPPEDHPDQREFDDVAEDVREPEQQAERSIEEICMNLDLAGSGLTLAERREAVSAAVEYLRENGTATRSEFVGALYDAHSAGYDSEGGWWNEIGKKGLRTVAEEIEEIDPPGEGEHTWRWVG